MSRPLDVDTRAAARAESSSEARPAVQSVRLMAGVRVPDSPLITEALEYAQKRLRPYLFNHAVRSWLFAEAIGRIKGNRLRPRGRGRWHAAPRHRPHRQRFGPQSLRGERRRCRTVVHQRRGPVGSPCTTDLGPGCAQLDALARASQGAGGGGWHDGHRARLWRVWLRADPVQRT